MDAIIPVDASQVDGTVAHDTYRLRTDSITKTAPMDENDIQSADIMVPVIKTTSVSSSGAFDVQRVYTSFVAALREFDDPKSPVGTQDYINGYRELLK